MINNNNEVIIKMDLKGTKKYFKVDYNTLINLNICTYGDLLKNNISKAFNLDPDDLDYDSFDWIYNDEYIECKTKILNIPDEIKLKLNEDLEYFSQYEDISDIEESVIYGQMDPHEEL